MGGRKIREGKENEEIIREKEMTENKTKEKEEGIRKVEMRGGKIEENEEMIREKEKIERKTKDKEEEERKIEKTERKTKEEKVERIRKTETKENNKEREDEKEERRKTKINEDRENKENEENERKTEIRQNNSKENGKTNRIGCSVKFSIFLIITALVTAAAQHNPFDDDDDELAFSLNRLYRDSEAAMDPHNMLPDLGGRGGQGAQGRRGQAGRPQGRNAAKAEREKEAGGGGGGGRGAGWWAEEEEKEEEEEEGKGASKEMGNCVSRLVSLQNSLQEEQATSLKLQKMLAKEGVLDLQAFYRRAAQHLWNTLRLQEVGDILKEGNTAVVRQVSVVVTRDSWEGLEEYLRSEADPHKVDEFLREAFTLETPPSDSSPSLLQAAITLAHTAIQAAKSLEVWLCVLCGGFVALAVWAVVLFVRDIQKELRWGCVLGMMAAVVFFICCLWHWRHMYKMAESRRHAELARRGYAGIPEECQPGAKTSAGTVYDWVKVNLFGSPDVCEKYFEQLMIDAIEEITPGMVIAETVSRFLFQPLQHLGTESGKLTTNFYQNVPPAYHLHATALFLGLLVVVLFYGCAYGIDFPLGLGGYRPMARQDSTAPGNWAGLGREAVEQLNRDREKFLEESRRMLTDIAKAAEGTKGPQQLVVTSSGILEAQLERLISRHLDQAMEQQQQQHQGVHTITSTPLRSHSQSTTRDMLQQNSPAPLADLSSSSSSSSTSEETGGLAEVEGRGNTQALPVAIDAVHRRVAGTPAVRYLPPRTPSRPGSATTTPNSSEAGSPSAHRKKATKFLRMFRSAEAPPSPPPSPSASTQSLGQAGLDEPDLAAPQDNSSFLAEVRSVLDLSNNSGPSSPTSPTAQD